VTLGELDRNPAPARQRLQTAGLGPLAVEAKIGLFAAAAGALLEQGAPADGPVHGFFVPGRIEVLGKHTDYAGGRSIVTAVEQGFCMVAAPRFDALVTVRAVGLGETAAFDLGPELTARHGHWSNYPMTACRRLVRNFRADQGADLAFASDLPVASGMSSSSALIVATALVVMAVNGLFRHPRFRRQLPDALSLAAYLGTVENGQTFGELPGDRGVGTFGGSEDHTAMLCSRAGHLGQFAYCPARFQRYLPVPAGHLFAVAFSGVVAEKTGAAQELYNRASLRAAAAVQAWREATGGTEVYLAEVVAGGSAARDRLRQVLGRVTGPPFSGAELVRRVEHFIAEDGEILEAAGEALAHGDLTRFGELVDRSQELTDTLLQNQVPQTVVLARLARQAGAVAASAFGAGFGGSVWALVEQSRAEEFVSQWRAGYAQAYPAEADRAEIFLTQAGPAVVGLSEDLGLPLPPQGDRPPAAGPGSSR
jgi:galactokinase